MKRILILLVGLAMVGAVQGQDYALSIKMPSVFSQYYVNPFLVNPALTGFEGSHQLMVNYRSHWSDFPESPRSFAGSYNGPVADRVGIGALLFNDQFGLANRFRGRLSYAYQFGSDDTKMSLGLSTDYSQFRLDNDAIIDPLHESGDDIINAALDGRSFFGATIGFYAEYKKSFYFGLTLPDVVATRIDESGDGETSFNYIATIGTWYDVPNYGFSVEPSLYLKKIGDAPLHVDINVLGKFLDERLYGGLSFGVGAGNRFGFLVGTRINALKVFYSYDVSFQDFQEYNNGSHEITISFDLFSKLMNERKAQMSKAAEDEE